MSGVFSHSVKAASTKKAIHNLERGFAGLRPLEANIQVYRGITDWKRIWPNVSSLDELLGASFVDASYVAAESSTKWSLGFFAQRGGKNKVLFRIVVPKGKKAVMATDYSKALVGDANEILLDKGLRYTVTKVERNVFFIEQDRYIDVIELTVGG